MRPRPSWPDGEARSKVLRGLAEDAERKPDKPRAAREAKKSKAELRLAAKGARERFAKAKKAEHAYARHLRQIARSVGHVVDGLAPRGLVGDRLAELTRVLSDYSRALHPWARAVASRMLADVGRRDERAWREHSRAIGRSLAAEIRTAPVGTALRTLEALQVDLITSIPLEAAERVQRIAVEQLSGGGRPEDLAREIMRSGHVARGRADLIARTETSRAASNFTQVRAEHLGGESYIWRTSRDADVRDSHRRMEGKVVRWDSPPTLDGLTGHAGCVPNCRCWPEPLVPENL